MFKISSTHLGYDTFSNPCLLRPCQGHIFKNVAFCRVQKGNQCFTRVCWTRIKQNEKYKQNFEKRKWGKHKYMYLAESIIM